MDRRGKLSHCQSQRVNWNPIADFSKVVVLNHFGAERFGQAGSEDDVCWNVRNFGVKSKNSRVLKQIRLQQSHDNHPHAREFYKYVYGRWDLYRQIHIINMSCFLGCLLTYVLQMIVDVYKHLYTFVMCVILLLLYMPKSWILLVLLYLLHVMILWLSGNCFLGLGETTKSLSLCDKRFIKPTRSNWRAEVNMFWVPFVLRCLGNNRNWPWKPTEAWGW